MQKYTYIEERRDEDESGWGTRKLEIMNRLSGYELTNRTTWYIQHNFLRRYIHYLPLKNNMTWEEKSLVSSDFRLGFDRKSEQKALRRKMLCAIFTNLSILGKQ